MISNISVEYTDIKPMKPNDAEFGITIDFERGSSDPVKVFDAMTKLLGGFKDIDRLILGATDPDLEPIMVLEDVEAASITSWVRNKVKAIDDVALKEFDVKQQVGKYAVKAKYRILKYLDQKVVEEEGVRLETLKEDLYKLATENPTARQLPLPNRIPLEDLTKPMDKIQEAKKLIGKNDRIIFKTEHSSHELDKSSTKKPSKYVDEVSKDSHGEMEMILTIRKPDLLGNAQWEFRHGNDPLNANIDDETWLSSLHKGEIAIVSGNGIECTVIYKYEYDDKGNLISKHHAISKIHRVIPPDLSSQSSLDI